MPIDLGPNSLTMAVAATLKKPPYLIVLDDGVTGKTRNFQRFISLDKPESQNGVIQVKGIFVELSEEEIIKTFNEVLINRPKDQILEMIFPLHRVYHIRSLVFNAVKNITAVAPGKA